MEDLLGVIVLILALIVCGVALTALLALCSIVLPGLTARSGAVIQRAPIRTLLLGFVNVLFFTILSLALLSGGEGARLLGVIVALVLLSVITIGLAAVARLVGERFRPEEREPLRQLATGVVLLELAAVTPLVGWFVVTLIACCLACGGAIVAMVQRKNNDA